MYDRDERDLYNAALEEIAGLVGKSADRDGFPEDFAAEVVDKVKAMKAENAALRERVARHEDAMGFALRHLEEIATFGIVPTAIINALTAQEQNNGV